jgi:hypothetical protein
MFKPIKTPPTPAWRYTLAGVHFERQGEEPFIFTGPDGKADLDMTTQRKGFVNRIMRYARANRIEADEQDIFREVWKNIAGNFRNTYFSGGTAGKAARVPGKLDLYHSAPLPEGLIEAVRLECGVDVAAEDDVIFLHELTASEWLRVLHAWIQGDEDPSNPKRFGPVWWYAIHVLGITEKSQGFSSVREWINRWKAMIPCPLCRRHFMLFTVPRPATWDGLRSWAGRAHLWVTLNNKNII